MIIAIDDNGKSWSWGYGQYGELGDGTTSPRQIPVAICGNHTFCQILYSHGSVISLNNYGQAWGWGYNRYGQLGLGDTNNKCVPTLIENHTFCQIYMDGVIVYGIDNHNKTWGWGYNYSGIIGVGENYDTYTPVEICGNHTFCKIYLNRGSTYAIDNNGKAWGWGYNYNGELGNGTLDNVFNEPFEIHGNHIVNKIYIFMNINKFGRSYFMTDNEGITWAWGNNEGGSLGIGESEEYIITPVKMFGNHLFNNIYSDESNFLIGIDDNNNAWSWGNSSGGIIKGQQPTYYGQLGYLPYDSTPVKINIG